MLAIVLSRRDWREYDQAVTLYTKERGKLELLARGIKKITAKNAAAIEPLCLSEIGIAPGKEINILTTAELENSFPNLRADLNKISIGLFAVRFYERMIEKDESDLKLFELLEGLLEWLNRTKKVSNLVLPAFILKFFVSLGFAPELERCVACGQKVAQRGRYAFDVAGGGLRCVGCQKIQEGVVNILVSNNVIKTLRLLLASNWIITNKLRLPKADEALTRSVVKRFSEFHAHRRLPDSKTVDKYID